MRLTLAILLAAQPAFGVSLWSSADGSRYWALDTALKWTTLSSYAPDAPAAVSRTLERGWRWGGGGWRCEAKLRRICTCAWLMSNGYGRFLQVRALAWAQGYWCRKAVRRIGSDSLMMRWLWAGTSPIGTN